MCIRHGVEKVGFLTFTFADDVRTIVEAQRRFNSMNSNGFAGRYAEWVCVVQRHKDDRIHFHLVVALSQDIRTGFDFDAIKRRDYTSASAYLKAEWAWLRGIMPEYHFGRHELLPVRVTAGFGRYVARYVGRSENTRKDEKGARLVRFSKGFVRCVCGPFSKSDVIEERARGRLNSIAFHLRLKIPAGGCREFETEFGPRWRYHMARLMYCPDSVFWWVLVHARESLELYNGVLLAVEEGFEAWELYGRAELMEKMDIWREYQDRQFDRSHELNVMQERWAEHESQGVPVGVA